MYMKTYMLENAHVIVPISMDAQIITLPGFQESGISMKNNRADNIYLFIFLYTVSFISNVGHIKPCVISNLVVSNTYMYIFVFFFARYYRDVLIILATFKEKKEDKSLKKL